MTQRNLLLYYLKQIMIICGVHAGQTSMADTPKKAEIADLFFKFSIHTFTPFFNNYFAKNHTAIVKKFETEVLDLYKKEMEEVQMPLYKKELEKINEKYTKNKETSYYQ